MTRYIPILAIVSDLKRHRAELDVREREKERNLNELKEQAAQQSRIEKMRQEQALYEQLKYVPIETGLSSSTNAP